MPRAPMAAGNGLALSRPRDPRDEEIHAHEAAAQRRLPEGEQADPEHAEADPAGCFDKVNKQRIPISYNSVDVTK
eukprot:13448752-Heterocapsa_arctica.AAC.1